VEVRFQDTAEDYAKHRAGFPDALFDRLATFGVGLESQRVVDVGTGTGTLARGFARRGCVVRAIDPQAALMAEAARLDREAGVEVAYATGTAERTGLQERSADVVTAGQCWHWFDGPAAASELRRVLVPGGRLVIAHFDWIPLAGNVVAATEALIETHNPKWTFGGGDGVYPRWLGHAAGAGFGELETFSFDLDVPYTHEAWRGRIRASAGVGASLPQDAVMRFDAEHAALLASDFAAEPLAVPHRVFAVIATS